MQPHLRTLLNAGHERAAKAYDEAKQNESCARFHKMGTRAAVTLDNTKPKK